MLILIADFLINIINHDFLIRQLMALLSKHVTFPYAITYYELIIIIIISYSV